MRISPSPARKNNRPIAIRPPDLLGDALIQGPSLARGDEGVKLVIEAFDLQPLEPAEAPEVLIIAGSRGSNVDDLIVLEDPREPVELFLRTDR